jgi:DNA phosphorothioation-dependent restriction protein DptG
MQDLTKKLDEYWESLNNNIQTYINNTREGYNTLQELLDSSTRAEVLDYLIPQISITSEEG